MKIQFDQLPANLARDLAPLYVIAGEEILFLQEAEQAIRKAAVASGFDEHIRFIVDANFDWTLFQQALQNTSLFSNKQSISLHLTTGKLSDAGKKLLLEYGQRINPHKLLIIRMGKLDAPTQKTNWYKSLEKIGVVIPVWPLSPAQMPAWIKQRLSMFDLQADAEGLQLLALRTEGNLLAAQQEIEKLSLLYPKGRLTAAQIQEASSNNSRYNVFNLTDAILQGNPAAVARTLKGLKEEAVEPVLVLWALAKETRQWAQWLEAIEKGATLSQLFGGNAFMERRKNLISRALQQHTVSSMYACLQRATHIDQAIKGVAVGNVWDELRALALALVGTKTC